MGKIRDYTQVALAKLTDLFVIDRNESGVHTTNSVSVEQIGDTIAGTQTHSTLTTTSKTLIGAINEAASSGGVDELDELTDVTITSATLGDNLRSDGNGGWINAKQVVEMTNAQWSAISDKATWRSNHKNTLLVLKDAPNLNATANDLSMGSAPYASGTVGEFVATPLNTDITFTLKSGAKFTVTSFVGKKVGIVNILNLKLTPTEATATGTEIEVGNFANIYTYGSGTYYTGVVVDDQTKLVGSYLMTLGNQKLYLKFTDSTTRAIALTIVAFSA